MSAFLAENRARINRSNRREFLQSFQAKRQLLASKSEITPQEEERLATSCARTDAKAQNRAVQVRQDIAKNEDGPLRRTIKVSAESAAIPQIPLKSPTDTEPSLAKHPGMVERFLNIETHLAIHYGPFTTDANCVRRLKQ